MDNATAIKKLFQIAQKQQAVITKLAQAQGIAAPAATAAPAAPAVPATPTAPAPPATDPLTKQLQDVLFGANPTVRQLFVELPVVGTAGDGSGTKSVFYKHHAGARATELKSAVQKAADQVLGANTYLIQAIGQF